MNPMSPILESTILALAIVIVGTRVYSHRARAKNRQMKVEQIIRINGVVVGLVVALLGVGWQAFTDYKHDTCVIRYDARAATRAQDTLTYDVIDAATGTTHFTSDELIPGRPSLREGLEKNIKAFNVCD